MIRFYIVSASLIILFSNSASGQGEFSVLDKRINPGEVLVEFDNRTEDIVGTYYLDNNYKTGNIYLSSGSIIDEVPLRYDLEYDLLEINLSGHIKIVPLRKLTGFEIREGEAIRKFQNCDLYKFDDGTDLSGICENLYEGDPGAFVRYAAEIKSPTYVPALDMGKKSSRILIQKKIFIIKNKTAIDLPLSKRKFYSMFDIEYSTLKKFANQNKLNYKKESELKRILDFINRN